MSHDHPCHLGKRPSHELVPELTQLDASTRHGIPMPEGYIDRDDCCAICIEPVTDMSDNYILTSCGHEFHLNCLTDYSKVKKTPVDKCPVCTQYFHTKIAALSAAHSHFRIQVFHVHAADVAIDHGDAATTTIDNAMYEWDEAEQFLYDRGVDPSCILPRRNPGDLRRSINAIPLHIFTALMHPEMSPEPEQLVTQPGQFREDRNQLDVQGELQLMRGNSRSVTLQPQSRCIVM